MHQAASVGVVEGAAGFDAQTQDLGRRQQVPGVEQGAQAASLEELHDQKRGALVLAPVVDPADVGMAEGGDDLGLGPEPPQEGRVAGQTGMKDLDGDPSPEADIVGHVDVRRRAGSEQASQAVPAFQNTPHLFIDAQGCHGRRR